MLNTNRQKAKTRTVDPGAEFRMLSGASAVKIWACENAMCLYGQVQGVHKQM